MSDTEHRSTFSTEVELVGYVVDEPALARLDRYLKSSLLGDTSGTDDIDVLCVTSGPEDKSSSFHGIDELINHYQLTRETIHDLRLDYSCERGRIEIFFESDGTVEMSAYGPTRDFHFVSEGLVREIKGLAPEYNWPAKLFGFSRLPRRLLISLVPFVSFFLLSQVVYYYYATNIGVDVSAELLYDDNSYYQDVERAIRSSEVDVKLDVLLRGQLKGFTNVSEVLVRTRFLIIGAVAALIAVFACATGLKSYASAYSRSFFAVGLAVDRLRALERKREIWVVGVAIALIVNIVAGLIVAFAV